MSRHQFGKKILIGVLSLSMMGSAFAGNAYADEMVIAGVAAELQDDAQNETASAPIEAAETLALAALELSSMEETEAVEENTEAETIPAEEPETEAQVFVPQETVPEETTPEETGEHPAILAAEARLAARAHTAYDDIAVCKVDSAVNIRTAPSADADLAGKIYNNCAANILDTVETDNGDWYKIRSGSVEGYIKAKYFVTGKDAQELAMEIGCVNAQITTSTMRLRESADLGSATVTVLTKDQYYKVEEQGMEFSKLSIDDELYGYVQNDYLKFDIAFNEAISIEEIMAQEAEEARLQQEAEEARQRLLEEQEREAMEEEEDPEEDTEYESEEEYEPETTTTEEETEPETTATEEETEPETTKAKEKETTKAKEKETTKAKEKETTKAKEKETTKAKEK